MIVSDAFCHSKYAQKSQNWFLKHARILRLDFCAEVKIFDAAVHNVIYFFQNADGAKWKPERRVHRETFGKVTLLPTDEQAKLTYRAFFRRSRQCRHLVQNAAIGSPCATSAKAWLFTRTKKSQKVHFEWRMLSPATDRTHPRRFAEGKHLDLWLQPLTSGLSGEPSAHRGYLVGQRSEQLHQATRRFSFIEAQELIRNALMRPTNSLHQIIWFPSCGKLLHGVRNTSLKKAARYLGEKPPRPDLPSEKNWRKPAAASP